jgi:Putative beta-barrel porin 2
MGGRGRARAWTFGVALLVAASASAQEDPAGRPPEAPVDPRANPTVEERPGRFRVGPLYLTPTFKIATVGLDTNVFYTPTDRRTDLTAVGGPGLKLVLPLSQSARLLGDGTLDYLYFLRTSSERQLTGSGRGGFEWKSGRTAVGLEEAYRRTYARLGFEVDGRRFLQDESSRLEVKRRLFGRFSLGLSSSRGRFVVDTTEPYLGTDLHATLSRNIYRGGAALEYSLTVKTSAVLEGEFQADRFLAEPARDANQPHVLAGLRTDASALVSGRALLGFRRFRLRHPPQDERTALAADLDATLNLSPRTRFGGSFQRDLAYSAFTPAGTPTLLSHVVGLRLEKELTGRIDLKLFLRRTRLLTDGPIEVVLTNGERIRAIRDDSADEAGADLGYRWRRHLRIGAAAVYTERRSTIATFGIDGLLLGGTVTYAP